jgi:hypothetical protein
VSSACSSPSSSSSSSFTRNNNAFLKNIELLRDQVDIKDAYIDCFGFFPIRRSNITSGLEYFVYYLFITLQMHKIQHLREETS